MTLSFKPLTPALAATSPLAGDLLRAPLRARVLVVDDNVDAADTLGEVLQLFGHDVRIVYTGEDALSTLDDFHPDCALLDIGLPGINGHELAMRIRASSNVSVSGCRLVAISGWGSPQDRQRSAEAGFDAHHTKPVDPYLLQQLLIELLAPG